VSTPLQKAWFPITGPAGAELATLTVELLPDEGGDRFVRSPQLRSETVSNILLDARAIDRSGRTTPIWVGTDAPRFDGASFGLTLALTDQRARVGGNFAPLVATGEITPGGRGALSPVLDFDSKCKLIVERSAESDVAWDFAFVATNHAQALPETRAMLARAQAAGKLRLHGAEHLSELEALWGHSPAVTKLRRGLVAAAIGVVLVIAATAAFQFVRAAPARECERLAGQAAPEQSGTVVAQLLDACTAALAATPQSPRLLFLTGQAHALNGSDVLAGDSYRRSAEGGDLDGMAAYGRWLWVGHGEDPAQLAKAYGWLAKAASRGSASAAEDLGKLMLEDQGPAAAEKWFVEARRLRENEGEQ